MSTPTTEPKTIDEIKAERAKRKADLKRRKAEREEADLRKLDELEREHGDENVMAVYTTPGMVVIRRPDKDEVDLFQESMLADGKPMEKAARQREASETLAAQCLLWPERRTFDKWCEEYGGVKINVGASAAKFADVVLADDEGKP